MGLIVYGVALLGIVTATLATWLLDQVQAGEDKTRAELRLGRSDRCVAFDDRCLAPWHPTIRAINAVDSAPKSLVQTISIVLLCHSPGS